MDVSDWRERINDVDRRILDLLTKRAGYVLRLAPLKRKQNRPIREPEREKEVLDNVRRHNQGPLSDEAVCRIFEAVMEEMRAVQEAENRGGASGGKRKKTPAAASPGGDPDSVKSSARPS